MVIALIFLGGCVCWFDLIVGDGDIPEPLYVSNSTSLKACSNSTFSSWSNDPEENWEALQNTLDILKPVCPHVDEWIKSKKAAGKVRWVDDDLDPDAPLYLATYNWVSGEVCFYERMFKQSDGEKACTLAHEWRHSRQNFSVFCRQALSVAFLRQNDETLVEDDADLYENKVRVAYFNEDVIISMSSQWRVNHGIGLGKDQRTVPIRNTSDVGQ